MASIPLLTALAVTFPCSACRFTSRSFGRLPVPTTLFGFFREGRGLPGGLGDSFRACFERVGGANDRLPTALEPPGERDYLEQGREHEQRGGDSESASIAGEVSVRGLRSPERRKATTTLRTDQEYAGDRSPNSSDSRPVPTRSRTELSSVSSPRTLIEECPSRQPTEAY